MHSGWKGGLQSPESHSSFDTADMYVHAMYNLKCTQIVCMTLCIHDNDACIYTYHTCKLHI